jgi:hypothetical protein
MTGKEPVEEGGADPSDMQSAGGAGREPYANGIHVRIVLLKGGDVVRALLYRKGEGGKREKSGNINHGGMEKAKSWLTTEEHK